MDVKIVNKSGLPLPAYETLGAAGMDLRANEAGSILPFERVKVGTGIFVEIPDGYEIQVRPRGGTALKHGIVIVNTPGTVDSDYRGEVCMLLINLSNTEFFYGRGDRLAQMVLKKVEKCEWVEVEQLSETQRGDGGFNSTGTK